MNKFYVTEDIAEKLQAKGYPYPHIIHFDNGVPTVTYNLVDWCIKNHFDYRGLIGRGLAKDATGLNIYN